MYSGRVAYNSSKITHYIIYTMQSEYQIGKKICAIVCAAAASAPAGIAL